jgi:hypothetical protein
MRATWLLKEIIPIKQELTAGQLTQILRRKYGPQMYNEFGKKSL